MGYPGRVRLRAAITHFVVLCTFALVAALGMSALGCALFDGSSDPLVPSGSSPDAGSPGSSSAGTGAPRSTTTVTVSRTVPPTPAQLILSKMNLRQKAAQTLLVAFDGETLLPSTEEIIAAGPPGGFLLLSRNVTGAAQLTSLTASLQEAAAGVEPGIGLLIAADQEGGTVQRIHSGVPRVPSARQLAEDSDTADAAKLATETAQGLLALGVNMNLAPVADIVSDPDSFLYSRSYSGDPTVVVQFVEVVTAAFERNGLISVVKHFPGHGSAPEDSHGQPAIATASQVDFAKIHLRPFKAAIAGGVEGVMVGHLIVEAYDPDRSASTSIRVVDGLLREGLGFAGLIVCDDIEMAGAVAAPTNATGANQGAGSASTPAEIAVAALAAGCDLVICSGPVSDQTLVIDAIVEAVRSGAIPQYRLDDAVRHMLEIKLRHGLASP